MINQEELDKMDKETIEKEIQFRKELMSKMVGTLYPSILADELIQLYEQRATKSNPTNC